MSKFVSAETYGMAAIAAICFGGLAVNWSCQHRKAKTSDLPIICSLFSPISYVATDSQKTKDEIYVHNQLWLGYCSPEEKD